MATDMSQIASSNSAGGGGVHFEQHVDAAFLALLLVRGIPPVLTDCTITEVHLQAEHLRWCTDDIVVVGENGAGQRRSLAAQVKQTVVISSANEEFRKTITDAWKDFSTRDVFCPELDRLAIITLRGTDAFLRHFAGLLECARASRSADDFTDRLNASGFVSAKVVRYYSEVTKIIEELASPQVDLGEIWAFLSILYALSFDLNSSTRQTETQIKSLLAYTADGPDSTKAADATWNELLREVGEGKPQAKTYRRNDLSEELRNRHSAVCNKEQHALRRLKEHSQPILDGIRTEIGSGIELGRERLVQSILNQIQKSQIVLISGGAGSGKSCVAKKVIEHSQSDCFTFAFRAEEFADSHLDRTLNNAQVDINGVTLGAVLSGQSHKLLLVDSVERLLEATNRDAFTDLLTLLQNDSSWHVILTCRDYSTDLVRSSLLQFVGVGHVVVAVPPLTDEELATVSDACPEIGQALANDRLRNLLSNPYMLDKATQMPWPSDRPIPENERAFRNRFWAEIIRADQRAINGMPRRRQEAFVEIALRRARALTLHASRNGLDDAVVDGLIRDSLVTVSEQSEAMVAPAHDVLEDWAILHWIDEQHVIHGDAFSKLAETIGGYPALRRSYRKWLGELVGRDTGIVDMVFSSALTSLSLPAQFRDDTLVSLLRSVDPTDFLHRHVDMLFAEDKNLLRRIIHLLRVGCMTTPDWFEGGGGVDFEAHVPDGVAWTSVLKLVHGRLANFALQDTSLLLGFIEDASSAVSWKTPYPPGSDSIVAIAHWLLPHFEGHRHKEGQRRVLSVIAKLPKCDEAKFLSLMSNGEDSGERARSSRDFRKMILSGIEGSAACRDLPDAVITATRDWMVLTEAELEKSRRFGFSTEMEAGFGIQPSRQFESFPPSAYQGPFFFLLRHHLIRGVAFLIELFDHSADWYGNQRVPMQYVERPFSITLSFGDGTTQQQWCNSRLWNMYRSTSVGPYSLQSALMALERRLLEVAEVEPEVLDDLLVQLLGRSKSAAITSVVASVATAHPHSSAEALLVLLRSRECIQHDRVRMVHESQSPSSMAGFFPSPSSNKIHERERAESDALPHRSSDLEAAVANLQLGTHAAKVHEIIDQHIEAIPPQDKRSDEDRIWLLALRRMDLREYEVTDELVEEPKTDSEESGGEARRIRLDMKLAEPDLRAMSEEAAVQHAVTGKWMSLQLWGIKVFDRDSQSGHDPGRWRSILLETRELVQSSHDKDFVRSAPAFVAAVCIRDHVGELSEDELGWCTETVCAAIEESAERWGQMDRVQRNPMEGDRPAAWVISGLHAKPLRDELSNRVKNALVLAVTHANDEVRAYAADGVGRQVWMLDRELAMRCVNVLATEAEMVQSLWNAEQRRPFGERKDLAVIEYDVAKDVRANFYGEMSGDAYESLDVSDWIGSEANSRILSILSRAPHESLTIDAFTRVGKILVQWWDEDDDRRSDGERRNRSDRVQISLPCSLEDVVLRVEIEQAAAILQPILEATDRHPREVASIILGIISAEDRSPSRTQFWPVWQLFADRVKTATWLPHVDGDRSDGSEVMAAIFLTRYWKEETRHWQGLCEGDSNSNAVRVHELFSALAPSSILLDNYVRFLYHIGESCLPNAFALIATKLHAGEAVNMLRRGNTVFMLESLLRRYVYGRPIELKSSAIRRQSVLYLLDALVESGSSSAYRMRDDFVTPTRD